MIEQPNTSHSINWGDPNWGQPGHNVHHASDGSWLDSHNGERE